jgi:hypothetical protein
MQDVKNNAKCEACTIDIDEKIGGKMLRSNRPLIFYGEKCKQVFLVCKECFKKYGG